MAITNRDIVLFQSQDNTDNDNGGGRRTSVEVVDGAVNNLFPDISRIDTTSGDVALRKVFPVVNTNDRNTYFGAHTMLRKTPDDPNVSAMIFYTDSPSDVRSEARNDIEAYLSPSFEAPFYLFGNNIQGSRAITVLQRLTEQLPTVGDVYLIQEGNQSQYVRVGNISPTEVTLSFLRVDYIRRRVVITLDQPLAFDFSGSTFDPDGQTPNTANMFTTQVSDAAKFYGTRRLGNDAPIGSVTIQVDSIYEQLVPAATTQTAIINADALQQGQLLLPNTSNDFDVFQSVANVPNQVVTLRNPITPLSLLLTGNLTDDGNGNILSNTGEIVGSVNYVDGSFTRTVNNGSSATYLPATVVDSYVQFTDSILINQENQGVVYIRNVSPVPTSQDVYIDYRSGGRWSRIVGNFDGTIGSDSRVGAGLISDNGDGTATLSVTLGANPDLDSRIIFSWGSDDFINNIIDEANTDQVPIFEIQLPNGNILPSSLRLEYQSQRGLGNIDLQFDAQGQVDSSDANITAQLDSKAGVVTYRIKNPTNNSIGLPDLDSDATSTTRLRYSWADEVPPEDAAASRFITNPAFTIDNSTGISSFDIGETVIREGAKLTLEVTPSDADGFRSPQTFIILVADNNGQLRIDNAGQILGTISINGVIQLQIPLINYTKNVWTGFLSVSQTRTKPIYAISRATQIEYTSNGLVNEAYSNDYDENVFLRDMSTYKILTLPAIIGSVIFNFEGASSAHYYSRNGNIFTAGGTQIGTIDNTKGELEIPVQFAEDSFGVVFSQIFTDNSGGNQDIRSVAFRTSATDLTTSSLVLRYSTTTGTYLATSDGAGVITGVDIDSANSVVDVTTGAVFITFTTAFDPTSLVYDAVAETTLPLNPELLGLDPVRLPPNGRVPVFDEGRHLVIFQEDTTDIAGTPTAGQTVTLSRDGQAYIEIVDVNGQRLDYGQFTADRDAGTVTFADPLSLVDRAGEALTAPYQVIDRVEDMVLATSVEITGRVGISAPLTRDYPADTTRVASALVWGDIGSRVFNIFSQSSFDIWSDQRTTNIISAQFDNINFPIQINNRDSFTGRWAAVFNSVSTVSIQEETLGVVISTASISADIAPINPATGRPYFTIPAGGWGSGWVTSNVLRFNTESGAENMWIIRTVKSGTLTEEIDSIDIEIRGDAN